MRRSLRIPLLFGAVVALLGLESLLADDRGVSAQTGDKAFSGRWTYSDSTTVYADGWSASTGYVSVPHASSLANAPAWRDLRSAAATGQTPRGMLAIIGLPVDTDHEMLATAKPERLCLAARSNDAASLCKDTIGPDADSDFSFNFDLCAFDGDCWHSTAAAILATGGEVDRRHFSLEAISKLPFWNLTDDVTSRRTAFYKDAQGVYHARFNRPCGDSATLCFEDGAAQTDFPEFPQIRKSAEEIPIKFFQPGYDKDGNPVAEKRLGRIVASHPPPNDVRVSAARARIPVAEAELAALQKLQDSKTLSGPSAKQAEARIGALWSEVSDLKHVVQFHEALNYTTLPQWAFPLVEVYSAAQGSCCGPAGLGVLVNENLLVTHGARRGGPFIAFNVFSAVRDETQCQRFGAKAPCVLTKLTSQERALAYLLERVRSEKVLGVKSRSSIAAILIIAGGEMARSPCDGNRTAELIAELRRQGVYTFVPVGNDGDPKGVRFPACASAAISVGSLDRNGEPMPASNGSQTGMVRLYADGDTAVIPMRAPPPEELAGCLQLKAFQKTIQNYQKALRRLGFPLQKDDGLVDAETQDALQAFQRDRKLPPSGKFTPDTLVKLDQAILALKEQDAKKDTSVAASADKEVLEELGVAENVRFAQLAGFEEYDSSLCEKKISNEYHAYFVGGTLVSAAVMAGAFLNLLDTHPQAGNDAVVAAMLAAPKGKPGRLLTPAEFSKVEQKLK